MRAIQNIKLIRFLFLISYTLLFISIYFMLNKSIFLTILALALCLLLDHFIPDKYAIRFEKYWHVKEPLFFTKTSGTTEEKIFIILGIIIFALLFYFV